MEAIGVAANVIAVVDISVKVASLCLQYAKDVKNAAADIDRLHGEVTNLRNVSEQVRDLLDGPNGEKLKNSQTLDVALKRSVSLLAELERNLEPKTSSKFRRKLGLRAFKWPFQRAELEASVQNLQKLSQTVSQTLQIDQTGVLLEVDQNVVQIDQNLLNLELKTVLGTLPVAAGASFDSRDEEHNPTCLQNTRVDLLRCVHAWANDPSAKPLFWLNGMAGTGKSTISRTAARQFAQSGQLGASFFFKRGEADRGGLSKFFTTIAAQLAERHQVIAPHIKSAVDANPQAFGKASQEQFDKLISQPFGSVPSNAWKTTTLVFVIDALDECDDDKDVKLIINIFSRTKGHQLPRLRFLITSRPELPIRLGFNAVQGTYQDLVLHEIPSTIIEHDIAAYLEYELLEINKEYNSSVSTDRRLPLDWPGTANMQVLVEMAIPLFIFAATVCRFLADRRGGRSPSEKLETVLRLQTRSQKSKLDATYLPILNNLIDGLHGEEKQFVLQQFRDIVGPIVILASPLSTSALARILDVSTDSVYSQLDFLHSVLSIPLSPESPVRLLHLSFRDFLVDPEKQEKNPFWVNEGCTHKTMAANCLRIMNQLLHEDICCLVRPGTNRSSITTQVVEANMPPELQYACLYWVYHIQQQAPLLLDDNSEVYDFLLSHILHWLEALSLMGRASEALNILRSLQRVLNPEGSEKLSYFVQDALRLTLVNLSAIDATPLQIYSSILAFTPKNSLVRQTFEHQLPEWITFAPEPEDHWDQCLQILEGHREPVHSVTFSPDGTLIASCSADETVRIWRSDDGSCVEELRGHRQSVLSVAFSPDGTLLASASADSTVRIWRSDDGTCLHTLESHGIAANSVAFSPDSTLLAAALQSNTVRIWCSKDGAFLRELIGHQGWVQAVVFSPDGSFIASASHDATVRIWTVEGGICVQQLRSSEKRIDTVAFSPDGTLIASGSRENTARVWRSADGVCIHVLRGHKSGVYSVAFSPDGKLIASGSSDQTIRLWRSSDGVYIQQLRSQDAITSVAFSPNGSLIASGSYGDVVQIWRNDNEVCIQNLKGHADSVSFLALSPDGKLIASASIDRTIRIWRSDDNVCLHELVGHTDTERIISVTFSPNGTLIASASSDGTLRLWRSNDGVCVQKLMKGRRYIMSVAFAPDDVFVAAATLQEHTVWIWRCGDGAFIRELRGHKLSVQLVVFSPDGTLIASASADETVRLWRSEDGACLQVLMVYSPVISVLFSPDSTLLASSSSNHMMRIWSAKDGVCLHALTGQRQLSSVAFSPDSTLLASVLEDKRMRVWCMKDRVCVQEFSNSWTSRLQFDPSASDLVTSEAVVTPHASAVSSTQTAIRPLFKHLDNVEISPDDSWILWQGTPLFWIPKPFRGGLLSRVDGSMVILGSGSGRVIVMRFKDPGF
ncbi:vegetative incompatibility protein HET-E-1 [Dactylonectria macrodidyma]|uniref:Intraflagellar transport protein 122 homolog n=1 Tax=Dactylonectria macrodidyma TaxID=307937 RepID=A0A9P9E158_9HYPO|nr:vegetative incompatibility protein HET-E-1 [Dactylonectria macrodidyma]